MRRVQREYQCGSRRSRAQNRLLVQRFENPVSEVLKGELLAAVVRLQ